MRIGIVGTGAVGSALGTRWSSMGHEVMFGSRTPDDARVAGLVAKLGETARAGSVQEAAKFAEVLVLATPWPATQDAVRAAGRLTGKIVIDCTNPLSADFSELSLGHRSSAGEKVARWAKGARVVKALNTTGSDNMTDPRYPEGPATMFVCGDDPAARATALDLVRQLGFDGVDAGPLRQARLLEPLAMLWISLAYGGGFGTDIAFRLMRRRDAARRPR